MNTKSTKQKEFSQEPKQTTGYLRSDVQVQEEIEATQRRMLAISAGDLRTAVLREVHRTLTQCRGHQLLAAKAGLDRLYASKLIASREVNSLGKICDAVFDACRSKCDLNEAFAKVRAIYQEMVVETESSPVALAIASIASSGAVTTALSEAKAMSKSNKVDMGIVGGAIGGALVGAVIGGGLGGAIIGAVIGGIAGGIATACASDDDSSN